jgi:hypothetical protein
MVAVEEAAMVEVLAMVEGVAMAEEEEEAEVLALGTGGIVTTQHTKLMQRWLKPLVAV